MMMVSKINSENVLINLLDQQLSWWDHSKSNHVISLSKCSLKSERTYVKERQRSPRPKTSYWVGN